MVESCYIMWSICKYSCDIVWWNVIIADLMCALRFMNSLSFPYYDPEIVWEIKSWCSKRSSEEWERGSNMGFADRMEGWIHFLLPYSFFSTFSLTPLSLLSPFIFWHRNAPLNWLFVTLYAYRLHMIRMPGQKNKKDFYRDVLFTKLLKCILEGMFMALYCYHRPLLTFLRRSAQTADYVEDKCTDLREEWPPTLRGLQLYINVN